jgi:hypothetical protein
VVRNTISLDQLAADHIGHARLPTSSLNLGVNIEKANRSLSWTRGVLLPAEDSAKRCSKDSSFAVIRPLSKHNSADSMNAAAFSIHFSLRLAATVAASAPLTGAGSIST